MFGEQFYPTPQEVIEQMLKPYKKENGYSFPKYILEPSAGKGDITDFIYKKTGYYDTPSIFAFELDPNLRDILKSKNNIEILGNDFLSAEIDLSFNLIVMNPPFSNGDQHLLKAWNLISSGDIICLLNTETILNPFSKNREVISNLIKNFGSVEHLGQCFRDAEKPTNVEVSIVRLRKEEKNNIFDFSSEFTKEKEFNISDIKNNIKTDELATLDIIGNVVNQYDRLKVAYVSWMKACQELEFYSQGIFGSDLNIIEIAMKSGFNNSENYNDFVLKTKRIVWNYVLSKSGIDKFMTTKVRKNFNEFIREQSQLAFSKENIYQVIYDIVNNSNTILEQSIVDSFDLMTRYYDENKMFPEGWKTNDSWKVNRKIIIGWAIDYAKYTNQYDLKRFGSKFSLRYEVIDTLGDIDRALCYMTGQNYSGENCITHIVDALNFKFEELGKIYPGDRFDSVCQSTFFKIKFFRKGTLHLEFLDEKIWEEFNIRATKHKNWLPKKEYDAWKAKRNGETRASKSHMIEQKSLFF